MNNATLFKQAHALTKATIKQGDSYQITFGACLRHVIEQNKAQSVAVIEAKDKVRMNIKAIVRTIPEVLYQLTVGSICAALFALVAVVCGYIALNTHYAWLSVAGGFCATSAALFGMFVVSEAIENVRYQYKIEKSY